MNDTRLLDAVLSRDPSGTLPTKYVSFSISIVLVTACFWILRSNSKSRLRLPGPPGIPLFGSLFDVRVTWSLFVKYSKPSNSEFKIKNGHAKTFASWTEKYGGVFRVVLGSKEVASTPPEGSTALTRLKCG